MILTLSKEVSQFSFPKINRKNTKKMLKDNGNVKNASVKNANNKKDKETRQCIAIVFYKKNWFFFAALTQDKQKALFLLWSLKQNKFQRLKN